MQERGLPAYLAELIGTFFLVFFITSVVVLFVATGNQAQFGSDYAVVGLAQGFALFGLVVMFGAVSGGHFNPVVTLGVAAIRRIAAVDALIYILAQLSGGVLGALLTKALLVDEGRATHYGAVETTALLGSKFQGSIVEAIGAFLLVLVVLVTGYSKKGPKEWGALAYGTTLTFVVMVGAPLSGGSFNPARWFGPALVANTWGGVWPYIVGPLVGALVAVIVFRFVIEGAGLPKPGKGAPSKPAPPSKPPAPPKPQGDSPGS